MKRQKLALSLAASALLATSCWTRDNLDYPILLSFPKEGDTRIINGNGYFYSWEILDYDGNGNATLNSEKDDSLSVTYQWLTLKCRKYEHKITLIAAPNTTGRNRKLYISGSGANIYSEIKVKQGK